MTIQELAEKLEGNVENKKINLNHKGYNTKKMSTKISVMEWAEGMFVVNCKITCPTQNLTWIEKEQEKIEDSLAYEIKTLTQKSFVIVCEDGNFIDSDHEYTDDKDEAKIFFSEKLAKKIIIREDLNDCKVVENK